MDIKIKMLEYPHDEQWREVYRRALVTCGGQAVKIPPAKWRMAILRARHSPIRRLWFAFSFESLPYFVSTHLARHIHAQPYIMSQRNDMQDAYDRTKAPQDAPVSMIWDINAEELMVIANKRLCGKASKETRFVVSEMCKLVEERCPEFAGLLVPMCEYTGECKEMRPCKEE